jgi:hypothetical protein
MLLLLQNPLFSHLARMFFQNPETGHGLNRLLAGYAGQSEDCRMCLLRGPMTLPEDPLEGNAR